MMRTDVDSLREILWNSHSPDCAALENEVVTAPDECNCNMSFALPLLDKIQRQAEVSAGEASLDAVTITFDEMRAEIDRLRGAGLPR